MKLTKTEKDFLIYTIEEAKRKWENDFNRAITTAETDKEEINWIKAKIEIARKIARKVK